MAQYKGLQSVLDETLGEYREFGFTLNQSDDHILELYMKDDLIGRFSQLGATPLSIRAACRDYLNSSMVM